MIEEIRGNCKVDPQMLCDRKVAVNIDCIRVCPMDGDLWAMSFYQQIVNK